MDLKDLKKMIDFFINNYYQIIFNVIGGLVTVAIIELCKVINQKFKLKQFKTVFGRNILQSNSYHIIYAQFILPPQKDENGKTIQHPYQKFERPDIRISIDKPVSSCELRAAKYLFTSIARAQAKPPALSSDYELKGRLDISFIALGGPFSNFKTEDANSNSGNNLIRFDQNRQQFVSTKSNRRLLDYEHGFDYGLILKINPKQFPLRTWIVCAGLGEWGSSGAAWYLANKWNEIYEFAKDASFAFIVKVKYEQDESAEPIIRAKDSEQVELWADIFESKRNSGLS